MYNTNTLELKWCSSSLSKWNILWKWKKSLWKDIKWLKLKLSPLGGYFTNTSSQICYMKTLKTQYSHTLTFTVVADLFVAHTVQWRNSSSPWNKKSNLQFSASVSRCSPVPHRVQSALSLRTQCCLCCGALASHCTALWPCIIAASIAQPSSPC